MVLQRWQTVYLLISVVAMALAAFFPAVGGACGLSLCGGGLTAVYHILSGVTALLMLVTIFKFKNLRLQKTLCSCGMLLCAAACVLVVLDYFLQGQALPLNLSALLPFFAFVCVMLAKGRIAKDDKLLHDSERLR